MTKKIAPVTVKEIDLADYGVDLSIRGRSGKVKIRPRTTLMQAKLISHISRLAHDVGISLTEENEEAVYGIFFYDVTTFLLMECMIVPEGEPKIDEIELEMFPDELIEEVTEIIMGDDAFPLISTPGTESKSEE